MLRGFAHNDFADALDRSPVRDVDGVRHLQGNPGGERITQPLPESFDHYLFLRIHHHHAGEQQYDDDRARHQGEHPTMHQLIEPRRADLEPKLIVHGVGDGLREAARFT